MIHCPNCGEINKTDMQIYNENLRSQNILITPILPTCNFCGNEVTISHTCQGGNIIVLNGTCGSGKTSIAEQLQNDAFLAIDGDCVIQTVRYKKGTKQYECSELLAEIAYEIDVLSLFSKNIVLAHIILPDDMKKYKQLFISRNLKYKFVLLKPEYQAAVERCQTRTCHQSITPELWIKHFYDLLVFDDAYYVLNNTNTTIVDCAKNILTLPYT